MRLLFIGTGAILLLAIVSYNVFNLSDYNTTDPASSKNGNFDKNKVISKPGTVNQVNSNNLVSMHPERRLELRGIVKSNLNLFALINNNKTGEEKLYKENEKILPSIYLQKIYNKYVVLLAYGKPVSLKLIPKEGVAYQTQQNSENRSTPLLQANSNITVLTMDDSQGSDHKTIHTMQEAYMDTPRVSSIESTEITIYVMPEDKSNLDVEEAHNGSNNSNMNSGAPISSN